ncbi:hypothetical protein [Streptomyces sp. NPDC056660]|uniref:hypothetical protein n=1 Tax=Streptomyces sp. NPDC056660 TaxID=3345897 RepID=UPI00367E461E
MSGTAVSGSALRCRTGCEVTAAAVLVPDLTGAARAVAADVGDRKPATAHRLGATHTVNSRETDALVTGTVALDEDEKAFEMTRHGEVLRSVVVL